MAKATTDDFAPMDMTEEGWDTVYGEYGEIRDPKEQPTIGVYQGSRIVEMADEQTGEMKDVNAYDFIDLESKEMFSVWGTTDIDSKMQNIPDDSSKVVRITWLETSKLKNGHTFNRFRIQTRNVS